MILDFFFPAVCPVCEAEILQYHSHSCLKDLLALRLDVKKRCRVCFHPLENGECPFCNSRPVFFDEHLSLFPLTDEWRKVLHSWKFANDRGIYKIFLEEMKSLKFADGVDRILYIRSGRSQMKYRNYQPCRDLSRFLAKEKHVTYGGDIRKRKTGTQSKRNVIDRYLSVQNAFLCSLKTNFKHVLLVEDVFTTGATVNEVSRILKQRGSNKVSVLSMLMREI